MKVDIRITWYFLAAVSCQEWIKQESTIWNYTCFTTWIILVYNEQHLLNHSPFHLPLFYFQKNHKDPRNYSGLQKADESWSQHPTLCSKTLNHSTRTKTNWAASLLSPRLAFLLVCHHSAICTLQRHSYFQTEFITFLGGNGKWGISLSAMDPKGQARRPQRARRPLMGQKIIVQVGFWRPRCLIFCS